MGSNAIPPQCIYFDITECQRNARKIAGQCKINDEEITLEAGAGKFCLIRSYSTAECIYNDLATCNKDAIRVGAICQDNRPTADFSDEIIPTIAYPDESLLNETINEKNTPFTNEDISLPPPESTPDIYLQLDETTEDTDQNADQ